TTRTASTEASERASRVGLGLVDARSRRSKASIAWWRDAAAAVRVVLRRSQRQRERRRLAPAFARTPNGQTSTGRRPAPRPPRRPSGQTEWDSPCRRRVAQAQSVDRLCGDTPRL